MNFQNCFANSVQNFVKPNMSMSHNNRIHIPTRCPTPENEKMSPENSSESDFTNDHLTSASRILSTTSSMTSVDTTDGSLFEIDVRPRRKKFSNQEEKRLFVEDYKRKMKTEMCKNWELRGTCKFGDKCCFAHGRNELKPKILTHIKYKTKPCKQYHQGGYCPYGQRCQYLHKEAMPSVFSNPADRYSKSDPQIYDILHEVHKLCNTDVNLITVLDKFPKRSRLDIFQKITMV